MKDERALVSITDALPELPAGMRAFLSAGEGALEAATGCAGRDTDAELEEVELLPVVPDPQAIWCVGLNYEAHRIETGRPVSEYPTMFMRIAASQVGHGQPLVRPKASESLDFEGELAVVIGKPGRHIPQAEAYEHVAGYSCYNDGSVRDWQNHTSQFGPGKNFHATGGFGPWLTTRDELRDPYQSTLTTRLNGERVQHSDLQDMIFKIPMLIAYLSTIYALCPGDVISTGTPSGVGVARKPQLFLKDGDLVEVEISGVGTLSNPVQRES